MKPLLNLKKKQLGTKGEQIAAQFLLTKGYTIIDRNFKARYGELDIIARFHTILVAVEVKTRIGSLYGTPEEAVTPRKLHEVIETFQYFIATHPEYTSYQLRIDVLAITLTHTETLQSIHHIENVSGF